jgi:hypothetical protein
MATTKLLQSHRDFLHSLAKEQVKCPAEEMADKAAYAKAAPMVRKIVETKYPPKDMKLLRKYQVASGDKCVRLQLTAGGVEEFCFRDTDKAEWPLRPSGYGCISHIYAADEKASEAVGAHLLAVGAFKKAMAAKLADYGALINHSTTLEQVEAVWPAAAALRPRLNRAVPVILSDEVIARIKADAAPLKKAA